MASLVLGVVGSAVGGLFGGFSLFGAALTGAQIGGAIGAFIGSEIDAALMPGANIRRSGPRLTDINIQASTEGAPIPRVYGRMRVAGQLLWATKFKETATTNQTGGGKGGGGVSVTETDYAYSISFAVGLCAGPITRIGRVWADGNPIDITGFTTRFYAGDEAQGFDPLIEEIEGEGDTPAYRGLAYIVFEDMPLAQFGNRIPQLQFEIVRSLSAEDPGALENLLAGAALIPGAGEFVYATDVVTADDGEGTTTVQNAHNSSSEPDYATSMDELQALAPNFGAASLVVGWFGSDLRCGECLIRPGVETATKTTYPESWSVDGVARGEAYVVSEANGTPAYGGTPSDGCVVQAIQDLKTRGLVVVFYPFLFMDIASGNTLTDPYTGASGQGAYPWRGRITCDPAPGVSGSPDKTAAAADQVNAFFGAATAADFSVDGTTVRWTGGEDWGLRRMILHYALLCRAAGGVDAFLIGSELRGLTRVRSSDTDYPAVAALKALAADVRAILGPGTKIGYAADWSEYNNHQTNDAPGAVLFNLDPLWSDANIDFVGIDNYMPLADWRDGTAGLDYDPVNGPTSIHDIAYLTGNIQGGEDYDWYYASASDRDAQNRTPITDALGKPWVWRAKDLWGWWSNLHYDRPDGGESATATGWAPQSKPIWLTEVGCPAVDKGANQPNVFFDPKSSESALPYYSNGERDDLIQRLFLEAHLSFWNEPANNPLSTVYGAPMVEPTRIFAWCWDARPFPFFPARSDVWGDAPDYPFGHWLNGRLGSVLLADLVAQLCEDAGFSDFDASGLSGLVTGYAVTDTMSPRDAIAPLATAYFFDGVESQGLIRFVMRGRPTAFPCGEDDLALPDGAAGFGFELERAQETDLPVASRVSYIDADADYRQAVAEARRLAGHSDRVAVSQLPIVLDQGQAIGIGQRLLMDAWTMRETARFALAPSAIALDPTDEALLDAGGRTRRLRLAGIDDAGARNIEAVATDPSIYESIVGPSRAPSAGEGIVVYGRALAVFLDLPLLDGDEIPWAPYAAAFASPWPGAVLIFRSAGESDFALDTTLNLASAIGETTADFHSGPAWRWDEANALEIRLYNGACRSRDDLSVLGGANALALRNADGEWEVLQYANAELTAPGRWRLTRLLRAQAGTEGAMRDPVAAGARLVLLDGTPKQLSLRQDEYKLPFNYLWGPQGKPISDPAYQGAAMQFEGVGLRPLSPAQLGARWSAGDLSLTWIRRTRIGGDSWDQTEVPLGEEFEAYDVEILDGAGSVVRAFSSVAEPSQLYAASEIASDFPSGLPSPFRFRVYQLSATYGRGAAGERAVWLV
ncbi:MAG TPA: glycoside hydrolase TIM-barrel-like domain-containing protein [Rhizomicrobium sp.]|nr:glycoside hydrolase TIM-barrel-like domain-containing protein [Rhizomicrobium sp.]